MLIENINAKLRERWDYVYFFKLLEVVGLHLIFPRFPSACNNPHTVPAAFCIGGKTCQARTNI